MNSRWFGVIQNQFPHICCEYTKETWREIIIIRATQIQMGLQLDQSFSFLQQQNDTITKYCSKLDIMTLFNNERMSVRVHINEGCLKLNAVVILIDTVLLHVSVVFMHK